VSTGTCRQDVRPAELGQQFADRDPRVAVAASSAPEPDVVDSGHDGIDDRIDDQEVEHPVRDPDGAQEVHQQVHVPDEVAVRPDQLRVDDGVDDPHATDAAPVEQVFATIPDISPSKV
jgi:hypothetical protein